MVLAGRSVGVGETVSTARRLRIPVIVAVLTDTRSPSCRLEPDGDLVRSAITGVPDDELAAVITERVASAARHARTEQRHRVQRMLASHAYRSYLAGQIKVAALSNSARASLSSPFRFVSLSTHETSHLARELDAFEETDFQIYNALPGLAREA